MQQWMVGVVECSHLNGRAKGVAVVNTPEEVADATQQQVNSSYDNPVSVVLSRLACITIHRHA